MRQLLVILLLLAGLVGGAIVLDSVLFGARADGKIKVSAVLGIVRGSDQDGTLRSLQQGDVLESNSAITTGKDSQVTLQIPGAGDVKLDPDSELVITEVSKEEVNFNLRQGAVTASVTLFVGPAVSVGVEGNAARVKTRGGSMKVRTDGLGSMDVAALSGEVERIVPGKAPEAIPVGARRVLAINGEAVLEGPSPGNILLNVDWPEQTTLTTSSVTIKGTVSPGAVVTVDGKQAKPNERGDFTLDVVLREGTSRVKVVATGNGDPVTQESPEFTVDTRAPKVSTHTDKLWK